METRVRYDPLKHKWAVEVKNSLGWGAVAYGKGELEAQMCASRLNVCWTEFLAEIETVSILLGRG